MNAEALRALERAHGIAAWAATLALIAAACVIARAPSRRGIGLALGGVAAIAITIAAALGIALDAGYRAHIRQRIFIQAPSLGWLFERKEHLAFGAIFLGLGALAALAGARLLPEDRGAEIASDLRRAARLAIIAAAIFSLVASIASVIVARQVSF